MYICVRQSICIITFVVCTLLHKRQWCCGVIRMSLLRIDTFYLSSVLQQSHYLCVVYIRSTPAGYSKKLDPDGEHLAAVRIFIIHHTSLPPTVKSTSDEGAQSHDDVNKNACRGNIVYIRHTPSVYSKNVGPDREHLAAVRILLFHHSSLSPTAILHFRWWDA